jgi:hypothetical protein
MWIFGCKSIHLFIDVWVHTLEYLFVMDWIGLDWIVDSAARAIVYTYPERLL